MKIKTNNIRHSTYVTMASHWFLLPNVLLFLWLNAANAGLRCPLQGRCQMLQNATGDYMYLVEGMQLTVQYSLVKTLRIVCPRNVSLESVNMPHFDELTSFAEVSLERCALPESGLVQALSALRVEARESLELLDVPATPVLSAFHLTDLRLQALWIQGQARGTHALTEDVSSHLPQLTYLRLEHVRLLPAALLLLPVTLKTLSLTNGGLDVVPRAVLSRLSAMRSLQLSEPSLGAPLELTAAPALASLTLNAPRVDTLVAGPALINATLVNIRLLSISGNCSALERLSLFKAPALPAAGWAACPRLRELRVQAARTVDRGLEVGQFDLANATALRVLELSSCGLRDLPSGLFSAPLQLQVLELRRNLLHASALRVLEPFAALHTLRLSYNPLGDLCDSSATYISNDASVVRGLHALQHLELIRVGVTRVCRDWADAAAFPALLNLDLSENNITELGYAEARWSRGALDLRENPLRTVRYTRADYERALAAPPAGGARSATGLQPTVRVSAGNLNCDCRAYWFARALRDSPRHAPPALHALRCGGGGERGPALRDVPLDRLLCDVPQDKCVSGCACAVDGELSMLKCAGAELRAFPVPPRWLPPPRSIFASKNNITDVPSHLPLELTLVDLRENNIEELDFESWITLLTPKRRVLLRGNPLRCTCSQRAALALLQAREAQLDAANVTCSDGRALLALSPPDLCAAATRAVPLGALLGALLGAVLLLSLLVLACLARPAARLWIKRFLVHHNLCLRLLLHPDREEVQEEAGECEYDVFVSFSHHDSNFVTEELVQYLEGAARPRRLCLHYRDWTPGEWIPTQISESVRRSRRTLVVLSEHFLRSAWARAEFREAYTAALRDARPRLVVLLMDEPRRLQLDGELRTFLATNTYLRRDDPRFRDKLLDALPAAVRLAETSTPPAHLTTPCA